MEKLLQYVWKHRLFQYELKTTDGIPVKVIDTGRMNTDEGPDFFNAKIEINGKIWAGNIEVHKTSRDWYNHKHNLNRNYNSVILHVVEFANTAIRNEAGQLIPQCEIKYPENLKDNIEYLLNADVGIPCCNYIGSFPQVHLHSWINTLLVERLERKSNDISRYLEKFGNSWEDVLYVLLTRNFGFGINSESFEQLALSLPFKYIQKHQDNILQIEALLFGQAGFLEEEYPDEYYPSLKKEYVFLKNKFNLNGLNPYIFNKLRIRPQNSPYIRLAQLAALFHNRSGLFSRITESEDIGKLRLLFHENPSEYWQTHYIFGEESGKKSKYLGDASLDIILINTVVPLLFAYGKKTNQENLCDRSLLFLENIKPEFNFITRDFAGLKIKAKNAYESQALIQLKREYCEKRKCLYCRIGYRLLAGK